MTPGVLLSRWSGIETITMSISKSTAVLAAADVRATVRFYCDVLGWSLWRHPVSKLDVGLDPYRFLSGSLSA